MSHIYTRTKALTRRWLPLLLLTVATGAICQDLQRGLKNYQEIMGGRRKLEQLSPQERSEVIQVHRHIQAQRGDNNASSACRDSRSRATNAASELADYSRRLRSCAESVDFSDDCSSEFRRVRGAHDEYESAVTDVGSNCR